MASPMTLSLTDSYLNTCLEAANVDAQGEVAHGEVEKGTVL